MNIFERILGLLKKRKSVISYTSGSLFNSFAQIISNIIILSYVKPDELGIWNSLLLFETYSLFLQGGIINGLNRELPYYLGKNDKEYAKSLAGNALFFFIISILLCLLVGIVLYLYYKQEALIFKLTLIGIVIITITKFYENYLTSTFRSSHSFQKLSKAYFFRGIYLLISVLFVVFYDYKGYIVRMVTTALFTSLFLHFIRPIKAKPKFSFPEISLLFKVGFPIFILSYIYQTSSTVDRLFLIKFSNFEIVGFYSLGFMAYSSFKSLPLSLANYIYPKMTYTFGSTNDTKLLIKQAFKVNITIFLIMLPIAILGYFLLPLVIPLFFPKYVQGIEAAQILLFAAVMAGSTIGVNAIWSMKIWKYIVPIQLMGASMNVVAIYTGIKVINNPLVGASIGVLFSQFIYVIITNSFLLLVKKHA